MSIPQIATYVIVLMMLGAALSVAAAGAQTDAGTEEPVPDAVVVDLDAAGDAVVTVTIPFDLTVADEQTDFEAFAEDDQTQQDQLDQYESRLSNVAAEMEAQTGREMTVSDASITTQTRDDGELGLVVLTASWDGLAATDGDQFVLGAPFDSGFDTDRKLVVRPPEQYDVASTTPTPAGDGELVWAGDQSLEAFEVVLEPAGDESGDTTDDETDDGPAGDDRQASATGGDAAGPGFGILTVVLGIAALRLWPVSRQ